MERLKQFEKLPPPPAVPALNRLPLLTIRPAHGAHPQQYRRNTQIRMRHARLPVHDELSAEEGDAPVARAVQPTGDQPVRALSLGPLRGVFLRGADVFELDTPEPGLAREPPVRPGRWPQKGELAVGEEGQERRPCELPEEVVEGGLSFKFETSQPSHQSEERALADLVRAHLLRKHRRRLGVLVVQVLGDLRAVHDGALRARVVYCRERVRRG